MVYQMLDLWQKWLRRGFISLFFLLAGAVAARGADDFAFSPAWLAAGHYQPDGSGYKSTVDSANFFLSADGKVNPADELEATIALFQSDDDKTKCLFPSRYKLLRQEGLIDYEFPHCAEYEKFYEDLRPAGVTLLFTDAYMNNPSSLFGHTLLRIDTARKGTQLLAHGANYGAFTAGQENSVLFAVYGLTGGYYGGFTVKPYYDIINTYNNIENRDIWEMQLDLTPAELDFFVAHLWEIGHTQSRYYFFTRNCSYMLMETLDAVRPELKLARQFPAQTIPLDTIKAVYRTPGLVKNVNYRPSRQNKIRHRYRLMDDSERQAFLRAVKKQDYQMPELSAAGKADVSETAYQYIQYQYVAKKLGLQDYRQQSFAALRSRNALGAAGRIEELKNGHKPFSAHESMRATAGTGFRNGEAFQEISYRPAYHSLTDDNYGFLRGAEINFLNTVFRHYDKTDKYVLQKFDLVGIRSVSPIDEMFAPLSFQILADVSREMNPKTEKEGYAANLVVGGGGTYALNENIWFFAMGNSRAAYGGFLPRNQWAGLGLNGGVLADFGRLRLLGEAEKIYATSKIGSKMIYKTEAVFSLSTNLALSLQYKYEQNYGHDVEESLLSLRTYF